VSRTRITIEGTGELLHEGPTVTTPPPPARFSEHPNVRAEMDAILAAKRFESHEGNYREAAEFVLDTPRLRREEAAKRLGGGPIVSGRKRTARYFIDGIMKRDVL
jgi:hypothetical protein